MDKNTRGSKNRWAVMALAALLTTGAAACSSTDGDGLDGGETDDLFEETPVEEAPIDPPEVTEAPETETEEPSTDGDADTEGESSE